MYKRQVGGGVVGGVAPANFTEYLVKSYAPWGTLLQVPEVLPLLSGGEHWRSRLTDQFVKRAMWWAVAKSSTVWKSAWVKYSPVSLRPFICEMPSWA